MHTVEYLNRQTGAVEFRRYKWKTCGQVRKIADGMAKYGLTWVHIKKEY